MPLDVDLNLPNSEPKPTYLTLDNFKRGVITVIDKSRLPIFRCTSLCHHVF